MHAATNAFTPYRILGNSLIIFNNNKSDPYYQANNIYIMKLVISCDIIVSIDLLSKMISISKFVLLFSMMLPTIIVALQFNDTKTIVGHKVTVYVANNMTGYQLGIDCKDKHHDFGYQVLKFGENYIFRFRPSFLIKRSLYFCSFTWINGFHYFDIYIQTRDESDCKDECHWLVKESGPCKVKSGSIECFHWNPDVDRRGRQLGHTPRV
jgi:hypothetical protein